ncbi:MAG: cyclic nucleotide-binding domain-containing protein, partial [Acidobacteriota bacterium]
MAWPDLAPSALEILLGAGERRHIESGEVLFDVGEDGYDLTYLISGAVEIIDRACDTVVVTVEAPNFLGELGLLMGQGTFLAGVAREPAEAIVVPQERVLELIATEPELSDLLVTAFAARRRLLIEWGEGGLTIVGRDSDADCLRLREFASRNRIPHRFVDRTDESAMEALAAAAQLPREGTAVITGRMEVLSRPSTRELARALGLELYVEKDEHYDVVVVGAGPAGLAAAVYGASEGLCCLVVEDTAIGGQAGTSSRIENYLGFSTGVTGTELAFQGVIQALKFGARIAMPRRAVRLTPTDEGYELELDDGSLVRTRTAVIAAGV